MNKLIINNHGHYYGKFGTPTNLLTTAGIELFVGDVVEVRNNKIDRTTKCVVVEGMMSDHFIVMGYAGQVNMHKNPDYVVTLDEPFKLADVNGVAFQNGQFTVKNLDDSEEPEEPLEESEESHSDLVRRVYIALEQTSSKEEMIARFNEIIGE